MDKAEYNLEVEREQLEARCHIDMLTFQDEVMKRMMDSTEREAFYQGWMFGHNRGKRDGV